MPAGALVAVHVSTDPDRAATRDALAVARRLPAARGLARRLLGAVTRGGPPGAAAISFPRDIRPWLGDEAALALVPRGTVARSLLVLGVADEVRARRFLARLGAPTARERRRGVALSRYGDQATAFDGPMLLAGDAPSVRAAIDARAAGRALSGLAAYRDALAGAPEDRAADVWAAPDALPRLLGAPGAALAPLLASARVRGIGLALGGGGDRGRAWLRLVRRGGGDEPATVGPGVADEVPAGAAAALSLAGLDTAVRQATAGRGAFAAPLGRLAGALTEAGVRLRRDLLPLLAHPVTFALRPRPDGSPALLVLGRTADPAGARVALARLQVPLVRALAPLAGAEGAAPAVTQAPLPGARAYRIRLGPAFELAYALWDDRFALATDFGAVVAARRDGPRLAGEPAWKAVSGGLGEDGASLGFLDLGRLPELVEATGLGRDATYLAARADLRRVRAIGARGRSAEGAFTAEITFQLR